MTTQRGEGQRDRPDDTQQEITDQIGGMADAPGDTRTASAQGMPAETEQALTQPGIATHREEEREYTRTHPGGTVRTEFERGNPDLAPRADEEDAPDDTQQEITDQIGGLADLPGDVRTTTMQGEDPGTVPPEP